MGIHELFFHIHYCNGSGSGLKLTKKLTRTLQHHELILVIDGTGMYRIADKTTKFHEGMLFYIPADVQHTIETSTEQPAFLLTVHFSYAHVDFKDTSWSIQLEQENLALPSISELHDYYMVYEIFEKLVTIWHTKLPGYEFTAKTYLQQLLLAIDQNLRTQHKNYATSLKIEKVIAYMQLHVEQSITLTELANLVHLSPTYLSRIFKETTGYPIIAFFNKIKIDMAKELMLGGTKKVKDISAQLGFSDEFYFSRLFKQVEGISPKEYYNRNIHGF
ncbi:helix-turn-helix transcriptional regulator [Paenilisteria rocourtiae]|uniref:AraC-like DNA-binding protein n=1 Tax=Listeria rocourtiae TaxID=647910 RepID=A0A4R6ZT90_9LIST|nr:AraC family transcriptional regulator [Listeria rocourtiae]EUJ49244.1 AraC family transcriptional regulator [Listeria rocourtiae FSL F6-920]MBC1434570.1 AraC family transcriptional regulator [Listeria rocourtiae]MBC1603262.1 AraC family transcriptional regulator [Listeria rocourtiae]TDR55454.1 AraC-like DNA-binding protein [Listeria rocourtiae]